MHRITAGLVALPCAALVAACARPSPLLSLPNYDHPPTARAPVADVAPSTQATQHVTLHQILAHADAHAPAIATARSGAARAVAERIAASAIVPSEPRLTLGLGTRRAGGSGTVEAEVALEQEIEIAGQRGLRLGAARAARALEDKRLEQARWQVHLEVHTAFHEALVARERSAAAGQLVMFSKRLLDVARKREQAGDISPLQVEVAKGELALASQGRIDAVARYRDAQLRLAELSGWPENRPPKPTGALDRPRRVDHAAPLIAHALEHHPALGTQAARVAEARALRRVADREAWPNLIFGVSYSREREPGALTDAQHIGVFSLTLPLPLFRRNRGARARAEAGWIHARASETATRRVVRVRAVRAIAAVNASAERVAAYGKEIIPVFAANMGKLVRAFELGEVDVLEVLVARGRFLELQRQALAAYADYFRAVGALEGEIGGDVWPDERHDHEPRSEP